MQALKGESVQELPTREVLPASVAQCSYLF